ncbi:hypothetical protein Q2K19_21890 [Micromonospora soli]|uniref:hypothetical protein n=1 Tax=Micromonospora sp. NBRC 110009 TaxID=3061627 RepID=UPI00267177C8|nr:hypothetical protein [Micromonospora sp. NBRC 110009]WKT96836.1 hypothetical protein Q2K19_21890 [Micromonospora sp. NBRC 110009]
MVLTSRDQQVLQARGGLIMAARRRSLVTYKALGLAIGISDVALSHHMRHVLDDLSDLCIEAGEPSLAALVVNSESGAPGKGFEEGDVPWHTTVQEIFRYWAKQ